MKTKQAKEEQDKSIDEETVIEPKTRARKKASDINDEDKSKPSQDEPKTSKETKKPATKPRALVKKRPLGIRKTLRSKKSVVVAKEKVKKVIRQAGTRGRKAVPKPESETQEKETVPLIPASEIKKEPVDDTTPNSRSSSPKTAGRRHRVSSDMAMMKTVLGDSPNSLVLGPRTSPYSMRSERSNSPSLFEGKNLRSVKTRKVKNNLLNEVVMKEQKKRRRLLSDSKQPEGTEGAEDCKKLKRGRSCSRDGSEISKCSDNTESDLSLSEPLNDADSREPNKKLDKSKTDLDVDIENNLQISTTEKVPSLNCDSKIADSKLEIESSCKVNDKNKKLSLKRSTSLDSDNNNSNRLKLENLNSSDVEDKLLKTDMPFDDRNSILTSMSKTFNSKEISKNMRKARRGRKLTTESRRPTANQTAKNCITSTITNDTVDDKQETLETLSREIDNLINNLDQNIDGDREIIVDTNVSDISTDQIQEKSVTKFYGLAKPLNNLDDNSIMSPQTPVKDKDSVLFITSENTPSKIDESDKIRLHYEEDSVEKSLDVSKVEITYKCSTTPASIDKLMDRLKEFEEFDKKRQRLESETKPLENKSVMVTNDVVLIPKSGAEIKQLKDSITQPARSPEKTIEKENVLSCFENNSAISIVKREQVRKSTEVDLPNSVIIIKKRNSVSARKESTSSNHSRENDAISIFEKSLGKDVTLTEIRKSVDKSAPVVNTTPNPTIAGMVIDTNEISITPRVFESKINSNDVQLIAKRKSTESISRKSSESAIETEDKVVIEKIKSPTHQSISPAVSITPAPVAIKSPEATPVETEALPPPSENINPEEILASEVPKIVESDIKATETETAVSENKEEDSPTESSPAEDTEKEVSKVAEAEIAEVAEKIETEVKTDEKVEEKPEQVPEPKEDPKVEEHVKPKSPSRQSKSARNSLDGQAGPSHMLNETPENQKDKEKVMMSLGLLTHKAAKEAKIEKLKEKERIYGMGMMKGKAAKSGDYTGTLKTVIKVNRGGEREKKKHRSSLKMTFQKSKYRSGKPLPEVGETANEDDAYYTIERREGAAGPNTDDTEAAPEPTEPKETLNLVIPEKASSFSIHPGRLCMDQCFYCGGKFGLFDTPCHIAQIKSSERQKKVLDNEEKLTIDSCLCDACYRHVDRRANCPSYRKRPIVKPVDAVPPQIVTEAPPVVKQVPAGDATCHAAGCSARADHSIRRKWLIKMRSSVNKLVKLKCDYPGLHTLPLCAEHYRVLAPLMACALCRRRLTKHHNVHFINHGYAELNPVLASARVPVQFTERPVLCKACRYYCSLLQRAHHHHLPYAHPYTRKLLQIHNVEVPPESENEAEDLVIPDDGTKKKKQRNKSKQRKSSDPDKDSESSERTSESTPEKDKAKEESGDERRKSEHKESPMEEDIESLILLNKILVPNTMKNSETSQQSDGSDPEANEVEAQKTVYIDKQTELQYLLQKQNNPAQFLQNQTNMTQKQRNILKLQTGGIQKHSQQHRINEKNAKRIHKVGQAVANKERASRKEDIDTNEKSLDGIPVLKNITLNDECTIETIPNKRPADINTLKNKWQMSESFTQVKKNLSELSKKLTVEKDPKKSNEVKYSNPVKRLETNPSISVRELFPGEEEMNLQCNIEFNNVKGVTPEGWEKCNTLIQYDVETKKLWNELQRPYGNQSSFLRHLILLEKYFRSGDLVLAHNASSPAANYSDSVQSRLRAYDNVASDCPRRNEPAISLIEFRKKPSMNGKSLLKSNQSETEKEPKKVMPPPGSVPKTKTKDKSKSKPLPPELIAIKTPNTQGRKAIQSVLHNIQQLVKGVSASDPTEVANAPVPVPPPMPKFEAPKEKKEPPKPETPSPVPTPTPKKPKPTSKPWRPTLMPITPENLAKITREPTQVAVDGRQLPSLVQVMSSGKRYHITIQDYNKMCIMRREKLQQVQDAEKKRPAEETTLVTEIHPSSILGNGGTVVQTMSADERPAEKKEAAELGQIGSNAATILKNVGLKNITIAPIPAKTATVTSHTPAMLVTSTPLKLPLEAGLGHVLLPKIPKSLTVIPQPADARP